MRRPEWGVHGGGGGVDEATPRRAGDEQVHGADTLIDVASVGTCSHSGMKWIAARCTMRPAGSHRAHVRRRAISQISRVTPEETVFIGRKRHGRSRSQSIARTRRARPPARTTCEPTKPFAPVTATRIRPRPFPEHRSLDVGERKGRRRLMPSEINIRRTVPRGRTVDQLRVVPHDKLFGPSRSGCARQGARRAAWATNSGRTRRDARSQAFLTRMW